MKPLGRNFYFSLRCTPEILTTRDQFPLNFEPPGIEEWEWGLGWGVEKMEHPVPGEVALNQPLPSVLARHPPLFLHLRQSFYLSVLCPTLMPPEIASST